MNKIKLLMTYWAVIGGMTAYADPGDSEMPATGNPSPATVAQSDPFAAALAVMNGEASPRDNAGSGANTEFLPPLVDCLHPEEHSSVPSAQLAEGKVSSFRIGAGGADKVIVSDDGGLWVGVTAVDSHVIEIAGIGEIAAGTYTLIDYEGSIGGAGFKGLVLRDAPHLHAKLVNNTAETKIELVVTDPRSELSDLGTTVSPVFGHLWSKLARLASAMKPSA